MNWLPIVGPGVFHPALADDVVTWLARKLTLLDITMWAIQFVATIPERILLLVVCSFAIAATLLLARLVRAPQRHFLVPVIGTFVVFRVLYQIFPRSYAADIALSLALLMAMIQLPNWRRGDAPGRSVPRFGMVRGLLSVILVPLLGAVLLNGWSLQRLAWGLHRDEAVRRIAWGDANSLAVDAENGLLYVSGHGTEYVQAYDVHDLGRAPYRSPVGTNRAQSFFYNPANRELYIFNDYDNALLFLNAKTLDMKKSVTGLRMTEGDSRIVYDRQNDSVIIASEGAYWGAPSSETGYPIAVVGRKTGQILYTVKECDGGLCVPALIHMHPTKPLLYMGFPKKVLAYNTVTRRIVGTSAVADQWVDGMAITPDGGELLVGAPLHSAVLRFDAESLKLKGSIHTVFGARALAVDPERNLLLAASLVTNMLDVIDLRTHERVAEYYVAPWLRDIGLDTRASVAYVSSTEGLFRVHYASRLASRKR